MLVYGCEMKKIWQWIKDNPWALITALVGVFGAVWLVKSKSNKIASLKDAVAVQATKSQIAADEARAKALKESADSHDDEVAELDARIKASKRRVVEIHEGEIREGATDDEIADLFSDSGL